MAKNSSTTYWQRACHLVASFDPFSDDETMWTHARVSPQPVRAVVLVDSNLPPLYILATARTVSLLSTQEAKFCSAPTFHFSDLLVIPKDEHFTVAIHTQFVAGVILNESVGQCLPIPHPILLVELQ